MTEDKAIVNIEHTMSLGIIPARNSHDVIVQATLIAKELAGIVKANKLSNVIQGRQFVRVEGWSTMGAMLGILPREMPEFFKFYDDGSCEATVELIRISDGAVIGRGSAFVGMDEKDRNGKLTWGSRAMYARRSMAVTRATGKAYRLGFSWIMALAGYETTPAEEMDGVKDGEFREATEIIPNGHEGELPIKQQTTEVMSLKFAEDVTTKEGKRYGDLTTEELSYHHNGCLDGLKNTKISAEKREDLEMKRDASAVILASRQATAA